MSTISSTLTSLLALCAFALACYGWGRIAYALFYPGRDPSHAYIVALGLPVLAFIGGLLNAVERASAFSISICAYTGILLGVFFVVQLGWRIKWRSLVAPASLPEWVCFIVIICSGIFLITTLLPTLGFNFHDDFLSYLPRIVRMRETGTLGGNPFELLGLSDFGVQSFFQGMMSTWLPVQSAYAFDTIFCFVLGLWLLAEFGRSNKCATIAILLAIAVYIIINPQIVNLSSVYSTAVLVLALLIATKLLMNELHEAQSSLRPARAAVPVGMFVANVVAIKFTSVFFILPFCLVAFISMLVMHRVRGLVAITASAVIAVLALLPWAVTHADKLNVGAWHSSNVAFDPALTKFPSISYVFQSVPTLYGGTRKEYAIIGLALLISLVVSLKLLFKQRTNAACLLNLAGIIGAVCAFIGITGVVNDEAALRYSIPFLIAIAPMTAIFHRSVLANGGLWEKGSATITIGCLVFIIAIFAEYGMHRLSRLMQFHTVISFPLNPQVMVAESLALGDRERSYVRGLQSKLPAGTTIWAWIDAPFQLDFARNRIWHFNHDWSVAPWRLKGEALRDDLVAHKVDYILWEYRSAFAPTLPFLRSSLQNVEWFEYRVIHQNAVNLLLALRGLANPVDTVYADSNAVLISLGPPSYVR
jgi:hypothetical protein